MRNRISLKLSSIPIHVEIILDTGIMSSIGFGFLLGIALPLILLVNFAHPLISAQFSSVL